MVVNDGPSSTAAAVFTGNRCKANPVIWSQEAIKGGSARAVAINSGGANCYTGPEGFAVTHATAEAVAGVTGSRRHRRPGLLHRPDRPAQRP